jgi:pimeloyl-ACP methyl ester carboxylesterase
VEYATNPMDGVRIAYRTFGPSGAGPSGAGPLSAGPSGAGPLSAGPSSAAPPIVLVHGTALSQVIWRGFGYVRDLGADHTVITLDLRGHGRSGKPHEESAYSLDLFVGDVLAVLDRFDTDRVHYVGYSLGGRVGFSLIDAHPDMVATFLTIAGSPKSRPGSFDRVFFPGCTRAIETGGMTGFLNEWESWAGGSIDTQTRAAFASNDPIALAAYMRASENDGGVAPERLAALGKNTLMLVGDKDGERLRAAEYVHDLAPRTGLQVIPGAGHGDVLRHPDTRPAMRAFLDRP